MIGQLAGGMADDFNNMLNAIILATDFLLNAHKPTDPSFKDIIESSKAPTGRRVWWGIL